MYLETSEICSNFARRNSKRFNFNSRRSLVTRVAHIKLRNSTESKLRIKAAGLLQPKLCKYLPKTSGRIPNEWQLATSGEVVTVGNVCHPSL